VGLSLPRIEAAIEAVADALADTAHLMAKYFKGSTLDVGERVRDAWETGIQETLELTRGLALVRKKATKQARRKAQPARSDALLLEHLRNNRGVVIGTQKAVADAIGVPPSTLSAAIKRLSARGLIEAGKRKLAVREHEI
jgi:CRP-like cAMP-binding protein